MRFLREAQGKASYADYARQVAFWTEHFRGQPLEAITGEKAAELIEAHADTPATRNRYIACLRALLKKAAAWEWTDKAPKLRTYAEPKQRIRWITREEVERLLAELPEWLAVMARFALATGLRQANVYGLEWTQVDLERRVAWVHSDQAKARRAIGVPLNDDAVKVIRGQLGKHLTRVFVNASGKPVEQCPAGKVWRSACKRAGITNFRWHDLRHTFASWHVQAGTPLYVLKELCGWQSMEMVSRYAHLAPEHLASYAEATRLVTEAPTSQLRHSRASR